jgi:hypothetical protein
MVYLVLAVAGAVGATYWRFSSVITDVRSELAAHKLHSAEVFATKQGMQEQTAQLLRAIEGVGSRIDGLHERLDRAFESKPRTRA